jgi:hypothetical protein
MLYFAVSEPTLVVWTASSTKVLSEGVRVMPVTTPAVTTALRFGLSFAVATAASVCIPFVLTSIIINATGDREKGMGFGIPVGIMLGWFVFPLIAWRPFRFVHLLALPVVLLLVAGGLALLPNHWLISEERDRYGLYTLIINVMLCALVGYGALTWIRNILLLRAGVGVPQ